MPKFRAIALLVALIPALALSVAIQPAASGTEHGHAISVAGPGVGMYPAFDPDITRYGVTTTSATGGKLDVTASVTAPGAKVWVNGRRAVAQVTVTGLEDGDEVSVIIDEGQVRKAYSLVYLPVDFPRWTVESLGLPLTGAKHLLATPSSWDTKNLHFEAAFDRQGVPVYVRRTNSHNSMDFKQVDGGYTVFRQPTTTPGRSGGQVVMLDQAFHEVGSLESKGLVNTDGHDAIIRPDGRRFVMAYERQDSQGRTHAVIQELTASGEVIYTWNSADHVDPATETTSSPDADDYAHVNSIEVMRDGDILASFRHFSSVFKIAWSDRAGVRRGDILWKLGGRHSDFTFPDDPMRSGPCAQHTASELANGRILIFDNGNFGFDKSPLCVNPDDPQGPSINRTQTRVVEYELDPASGQAKLVWSYAPPGWFALFAGSARRMDNGNTLIGWASERKAFASEVNAAGEKVWELRNAEGLFSYRVAPANVADTIPPTVTLTSPADGAHYTVGQRVSGDFECTDRGGSTLQDCSVSDVDTGKAGVHAFSVTARDGAGNVTTAKRTYTVAAAPFSRSDAMIRKADGRWIGNNVYGTARRQKVTVDLPRDRAVRWGVVRLQNDGNRKDRLNVQGSRGGKRFQINYFAGNRNVTSRVVAGKWSTKWLAKGQAQNLRVRVTRLRPARTGHAKTVVVRASAARDGTKRDHVGLVVRTRR